LGRLTKMENTNQSSSVRAEEPEFFAAKNMRESMVGGDRRLARMIDQTNLRPEATEEQIIRLCREAREFDFAAVVVNAAYVELASTELAGSEVKVASVVGFPLGATLSSVKRFEASEALKLGAREIDMVLNLGALKSGKRELVQADIRSVAEVTHERGGLLKVILETVLLTEDEKQLACELSVKAGADFVKTSTGFLGGGATVGDVQLMRRIVGPSIGVKASGGIRTAADAKAMIEAGANRIGTSSGVKIIEELREPLPTTR
jgi:deoxyribose-phosphate aldolase